MMFSQLVAQARSLQARGLVPDSPFVRAAQLRDRHGAEAERYATDPNTITVLREVAREEQSYGQR